MSVFLFTLIQPDTFHSTINNGNKMKNKNDTFLIIIHHFLRENHDFESDTQVASALSFAVDGLDGLEEANKLDGLEQHLAHEVG